MDKIFLNVVSSVNMITTTSLYNAGPPPPPLKKIFALFDIFAITFLRPPPTPPPWMIPLLSQIIINLRREIFIIYFIFIMIHLHRIFCRALTYWSLHVGLAVASAEKKARFWKIFTNSKFCFQVKKEKNFAKF